MFKDKIDNLDKFINQKQIEISNEAQNSSSKYIKVLEEYCDMNLSDLKLKVRETYYGIELTTELQSFNKYGYLNDGIVRFFFNKEKKRFERIVFNERNFECNGDINEKQMDYINNLQIVSEFQSKFYKALSKYGHKIAESLSNCALDDAKLIELENVMKAAERLRNFLNNEAAAELKINEIFQNKGIKLNKYMVSSYSFSNDYSHFDEIKFTKNPSETYTATLLNNGVIKSQSKRLKQKVLINYLRQFANVSLNEERDKD